MEGQFQIVDFNVRWTKIST